MQQQIQFHSCNYRMYVFNGSDASQIILIVSQILLSVFLLVQMCRLCTKVFSYHKFHIHEAYRFYTIAFMSTVLITIHRVTQLKLNEEQAQDKQTGDKFDPDKNTLYGYRIMNQLMGAISISTTNIMYIVIAFTWLNIAWGCDFNSKSQNISDTFQSIDQQPISRIQEQHSGIERKKQQLKNKIKWGKNISFYFLFPFFLIFIVYATLDRSNLMCQSALVVMLISSQLPYFLLMYSLILFLKKRIRSQQTPIYTKIILIYLIVAMTMRCVWFNVLAVQGTQQHSHEVFQVVYNLLISTLPILGLSILSQKQLAKQGIPLIRSERVMLMQSTII